MNKTECEFLRNQAKQIFAPIRSDWIDLCLWAAPHRAKWLLSQEPGVRNNRHIVDGSHILALRSYVAGFMEGNTSATRPWYRCGTRDPELNLFPANHEWLDKFTRQTQRVLNTSNFYHAAGQNYYDTGTVNTGAYYIDELPQGLFFHVLTPGSYFVINNAFGEAVILVREWAMTVKALVDNYGPKKPNGGRDWSNISSRVRKLYEDGNYKEKINVVQIVKENDEYNPSKPAALMNRRWISHTYEIGGSTGQYYFDDNSNATTIDVNDKDRYLEVTARNRKPFIISKSDVTAFEYGETGPTLNALGAIKSLNKKAISKDQALEQIVKPALQGPGNLKKSYVTSVPNSYVPLDAHSIAKGSGLRPIFEINPAIAALIQDVGDIRTLIDKFYFADFLLYLSQNPKTRTAEETRAILAEQQLIVGPNLQSLNFTHNVPVTDYVMDYTLENDPTLPPPPPDLEGQFLAPEFISVFAQAQRAADLPNVERYLQAMLSAGAIDKTVFDKANLDKIADIYEDRLYLPAGINRDQEEVDALREQRQVMMERQMQMEQMAMAAGAAKDLGVQVNNQNEGV